MNDILASEKTLTGEVLFLGRIGETEGLPGTFFEKSIYKEEITNEGVALYKPPELPAGLKFGGQGTEMRINHNERYEPNPELTITAIIQPTTNTFQNILAKYGGSFQQGYLFMMRNDRCYFSVGQNGSPWVTWDVISPHLVFGQYYHLAATIRDNDVIQMIVNGRVVDETAIGSYTATTEPVYIGFANNYPPYPYNDVMLELHMYNRVLQVKEILQEIENSPFSSLIS